MEAAEARLLRPGRLAALVARVRGGALDEAFISGADPTDSRLLAARALQLTSPRHRALLAEGLQRLLRRAQTSPGRLRAVRPRGQAVRANASALALLASLLDSRAPVYAQGVAALGRLLADGTGPAHQGDAETLASALRECHARMSGAR